MDDVAAREIPVYFEVEEEIISAAAGAKVTTQTSVLDSTHFLQLAFCHDLATLQ